MSAPEIYAVLVKAGALPEGAVTDAAQGAYNGADPSQLEMLWLMQVGA